MCVHSTIGYQIGQRSIPKRLGGEMRERGGGSVKSPWVSHYCPGVEVEMSFIKDLIGSRSCTSLFISDLT